MFKGKIENHNPLNDCTVVGEQAIANEGTSLTNESTQVPFSVPPDATATSVNVENSEININQQKEYFKNAGMATQQRENLQTLMLKVYEQDSYLDIFSVREFQCCLDKLRESSNTEEAVRKLNSMRNMSVRTDELSDIDIKLDELQLLFMQNQVQLGSIDAILINRWFVCALESIAKLKTAIEFQKKAIGYKAEYLVRLKHLFDSTQTVHEVVNQGYIIVEELKSLVDSARVDSEWAYGYIEDRVEITLNDTQKAINASFFPASRSIMSIFLDSFLDKSEINNSSELGASSPFFSEPRGK